MAGTIGIDAVYVTDAQSRTAVPVAGDFFDDGTPIPKWLQGLKLAFGATDGTPVFTADADGQRFPVEAPAVVDALLSPPPLVQLGLAAPVAVTSTNPATPTVIVPATPGRTRLNLSHAGGLPVGGAFNSARIWIAVGQNPVIGSGDFLDPGDPWWDYIAATADVRAVIDPAAVSAGVTSVPVAYSEWGA